MSLLFEGCKCHDLPKLGSIIVKGRDPKKIHRKLWSFAIPPLTAPTSRPTPPPRMAKDHTFLLLFWTPSLTNVHWEGEGGGSAGHGVIQIGYCVPSILRHTLRERLIFCCCRFWNFYESTDICSLNMKVLCLLECISIKGSDQNSFSASLFKTQPAGKTRDKSGGKEESRLRNHNPSGIWHSQAHWFFCIYLETLSQKVLWLTPNM